MRESGHKPRGEIRACLQYVAHNAMNIEDRHVITTTVATDYPAMLATYNVYPRIMVDQSGAVVSRSLSLSLFIASLM